MKILSRSELVAERGRDYRVARKKITAGTFDRDR
jgi:hypothetical protein